MSWACFRRDASVVSTLVPSPVSSERSGPSRPPEDDLERVARPLRLPPLGVGVRALERPVCGVKYALDSFLSGRPRSQLP